MGKGTCIYCKKENGFSREHAFPKALLNKGLIGTEHEWIIANHVCKSCNNGELSKLDAILVKRSSIAFIHNRIQAEFQNKPQTVHESIYHKPICGINPMRLFSPNHFCDNHILMHEPVTESGGPSLYCDKVKALVPQMILTQYTEGQTAEEIVAENYEKFKATSSDEEIITEHDEQEGVYCIWGNTYVFAPEAAWYFFDRVSEFKSKFLNDFPRTRYDLRVLFPEEGQYQGSAHTFCESLQGEKKKVIAAAKFPDAKPSEQVIQVIADREVELYVPRALAKIAFHCFLYHYGQFSGRESMFDDIREFIYRGYGDPNRFVSAGRDSAVYFPSEPQHQIGFFVKGGDIGCRLVVFTGLTIEPFCSQIVLTGDPYNSTPSCDYAVSVPFYVHHRSQLTRRILPVKRLRTIWTPPWYEG